VSNPGNHFGGTVESGLSVAGTGNLMGETSKEVATKRVFVEGNKSVRGMTSDIYLFGGERRSENPENERRKLQR
jgi:hypothetical protein